MGQSTHDDRPLTGADIRRLLCDRYPELRAALPALATPRQRIEWAVAFAQEDLASLSPGRLTDVWFEMTAFQMWGGHRVELPILRDLDVSVLRRVQGEFRRLLAAAIAQEDCDLPRLAFDPSYRPAFEPPLQKTVVPLGRAGELPDRFALAVYALALLLNDYDKLIRSCPAHKPHSRKGEVCGRWFVGRPDQTYCSSICQNRAFRQKKALPASRTKG